MKIFKWQHRCGVGHLRLITSKGAGTDLSQGGVAVHFTLDKCGLVSYSSKANDDTNKTIVSIPQHESICLNTNSSHCFNAIYLWFRHFFFIKGV